MVYSIEGRLSTIARRSNIDATDWLRKVRLASKVNCCYRAHCCPKRMPCNVYLEIGIFSE
jgi:hypothetical protein